MALLELERPAVLGREVQRPARDGRLYVEKRIEELLKQELILEDGIPLETNWHRLQMNFLIEAVLFHWHNRDDFFVGGNMFVYYNFQQIKTLDYRGPDVFVVKNVNPSPMRECWVVWEEGGQFPDVIIELMSPSTKKTDLVTKKEIYEKFFHTSEYFCYDRDTEKLLGWKLDKSEYKDKKADEQGWLYSEELGAWLGKWRGKFQKRVDLWIRLFDEQKQLIPTSEEFQIMKSQKEAKRAEEEAKRADKEAQRAQEEAKRADKEAQRAQEAEGESERLRRLLAKHRIVDNGSI